MTPEQLRILTDALAAAGSAIGGPGSVGELVGKTVIARNRRQELAELQKQSEIEREQRQAARGRQFAEQLGATPEMTTTARDYLQGIGQFPGMVDQTAGNVLTPKEAPGLTSLKAGSTPGTYIAEFNLAPAQQIPSQASSAQSGTITQQPSPIAGVSIPESNLLTAEDYKAIVTNKLREAALPSPELKAIELAKARNTAFFAEPVKVGDITTTRGELAKYLLGEQEALTQQQYTTSNIAYRDALEKENIKLRKQLEETVTPSSIRETKAYMKLTPEEKSAFQESQGSRATRISLGQKVSEAEALGNVKLTQQARQPKFKSDIIKQFNSDPANRAILGTIAPGPETEGYEEAVNARNSTINDMLYERLSASVQGEVKIKLYDDGPWFIVEDNGKITKLQRLEQ